MHIIDVSRLDPGEYRVEHIRGHAVYVVHKSKSVWNVFAMDTRDGKIQMPDLQWWRPSGYWCANFGPTTTNGKITSSSRFRCADSVTEMWSWYFTVWQWDMDGHWIQSAGVPTFDDLPSPPFEQKNDRIYVLRGLSRR